MKKFYSYRIEAKKDLNETNWQNIGTVTIPHFAESTLFTDTNSPAITNRFYRAVKTP